MLDLARLRSELASACDDAGLDPGSIVVFVVDAPRPAGTTPIAYLNPSGFVWPDTVAVFRAVGGERTRRLHLAAHRLALWSALPRIPPAALGTMLRHELEHARRWEKSGSRFFEADDLLRAAIRAADGRGYSDLPSECEANAASSAYAARTLAPAELAELRSVPDCALLVDAKPPPGDVVEATLTELRRRSDWAPWMDTAARRTYIAGVRAACAEWDSQTARLFVAGRERPEIEIVSPEHEPA